MGLFTAPDREEWIRPQSSWSRETEPIFHNLSAVLEKATSSLEKATKVNVLLADMGDFAAMNEIYTMVPKPVATRKAEGASRITS
ncbi:uncharacterized protein PADG_11518 [Paracoccidioides brasiliensis Pb18]|uniref:Uncharacterized protein n=1 Tax=Paracoccidioides brasiliensis (strain Pb18) TaxID=502780 RepID=A0A0A0HVE9_PARBD|nr:uncharacterized protein PADG_11518 [Paracoccidioides brasiliensis Pb18]KGM92323.1 hypothetical protein PADG_11518 [Paracoccidioides brasiliensis Pb18]